MACGVAAVETLDREVSEAGEAAGAAGEAWVATAFAHRAQTEGAVVEVAVALEKAAEVAAGEAVAG